MKISLVIVALLTVLIFLSQTFLIMAQTETQHYKVIKTVKDFEIRLPEIQPRGNFSQLSLRIAEHLRHV